MLPELPGLVTMRLDAIAFDRDDAIRQCGRALVEAGAAAPAYIDTMLDQERSLSTYAGEGVAIPRGTVAGRDLVHHDAVCVIRFPGGVDWGGNRVALCVGVTAREDGHARFFSELGRILLDPDQAEALRDTADAVEVLGLLQSGGEEAGG